MVSSIALLLLPQAGKTVLNLLSDISRYTSTFSIMEKWNDIYKIIERENVLIIYESSNSALILPKRFFDNDKDLISVKELIKENMSKNKYEMINNK